MTPFGRRLVELRARKGVTQKDMAAAIGVSPAYLSALEHGKRGAPSWPLVQKIVGYFNIIWDEAEDLQALAATSHPRIVVDTAGLTDRATLLANRMAADIGKLSDEDIESLLELLDKRLRARKGS